MQEIGDRYRVLDRLGGEQRGDEAATVVTRQPLQRTIPPRVWAAIAALLCGSVVLAALRWSR
jgi:hypothetical protein